MDNYNRGSNAEYINIGPGHRSKKPNNRPGGGNNRAINSGNSSQSPDNNADQRQQYYRNSVTGNTASIDLNFTNGFTHLNQDILSHVSKLQINQTGGIAVNSSANQKASSSTSMRINANLENLQQKQRNSITAKSNSSSPARRMSNSGAVATPDRNSVTANLPIASPKIPKVAAKSKSGNTFTGKATATGGVSTKSAAVSKSGTTRNSTVVEKSAKSPPASAVNSSTLSTTPPAENRPPQPGKSFQQLLKEFTQNPGGNITWKIKNFPSDSSNNIGNSPDDTGFVIQSAFSTTNFDALEGLPQEVFGRYVYAPDEKWWNNIKALGMSYLFVENADFIGKGLESHVFAMLDAGQGESNGMGGAVVAQQQQQFTKKLTKLPHYGRHTFVGKMQLPMSRAERASLKALSKENILNAKASKENAGSGNEFLGSKESCSFLLLVGDFSDMVNAFERQVDDEVEKMLEEEDPASQKGNSSPTRASITSNRANGSNRGSSGQNIGSGKQETIRHIRKGKKKRLLRSKNLDTLKQELVNCALMKNYVVKLASQKRYTVNNSKTEEEDFSKNAHEFSVFRITPSGIVAAQSAKTAAAKPKGSSSRITHYQASTNSPTISWTIERLEFSTGISPMDQGPSLGFNNIFKNSSYTFEKYNHIIDISSHIISMQQQHVATQNLQHSNTVQARSSRLSMNLNGIGVSSSAGTATGSRSNRVSRMSMLSVGEPIIADMFKDDSTGDLLDRDADSDLLDSDIDSSLHESDVSSRLSLDNSPPTSPRNADGDIVMPTEASPVLMRSSLPSATEILNNSRNSVDVEGPNGGGSGATGGISPTKSTSKPSSQKVPSKSGTSVNFKEQIADTTSFHVPIDSTDSKRLEKMKSEPVSPSNSRKREIGKFNTERAMTFDPNRSMVVFDNLKNLTNHIYRMSKVEDANCLNVDVADAVAQAGGVPVGSTDNMIDFRASEFQQQLNTGRTGSSDEGGQHILTGRSSAQHTDDSDGAQYGLAVVTHDHDGTMAGANKRQSRVVLKQGELGTIELTEAEVENLTRGGLKGLEEQEKQKLATDENTTTAAKEGARMSRARMSMRSGAAGTGTTGQQPRSTADGRGEDQFTRALRTSMKIMDEKMKSPGPSIGPSRMSSMQSPASSTGVINRVTSSVVTMGMSSKQPNFNQVGNNLNNLNDVEEDITNKTAEEREEDEVFNAVYTRMQSYTEGMKSELNPRQLTQYANVEKSVPGEEGLDAAQLNGPSRDSTSSNSILQPRRTTMKYPRGSSILGQVPEEEAAPLGLHWQVDEGSTTTVAGALKDKASLNQHLAKSGNAKVILKLGENFEQELTKDEVEALTNTGIAGIDTLVEVENIEVQDVQSGETMIRKRASQIVDIIVPQQQQNGNSTNVAAAKGSAKFKAGSTAKVKSSAAASAKSSAKASPADSEASMVSKRSSVSTGVTNVKASNKPGKPGKNASSSAKKATQPAAKQKQNDRQSLSAQDIFKQMNIEKLVQQANVTVTTDSNTSGQQGAHYSLYRREDGSIKQDDKYVTSRTVYLDKLSNREKTSRISLHIHGSEEVYLWAKETITSMLSQFPDENNTDEDVLAAAAAAAPLENSQTMGVWSQESAIKKQLHLLQKDYVIKCCEQEPRMLKDYWRDLSKAYRELSRTSCSASGGNTNTLEKMWQFMEELKYGSNRKYTAGKDSESRISQNDLVDMLRKTRLPSVVEETEREARSKSPISPLISQSNSKASVAGGQQGSFPKGSSSAKNPASGGSLRMCHQIEGRHQMTTPSDLADAPTQTDKEKSQPLSGSLRKLRSQDLDGEQLEAQTPGQKKEQIQNLETANSARDTNGKEQAWNLESKAPSKDATARASAGELGDLNHFNNNSNDAASNAGSENLSKPKSPNSLEKKLNRASSKRMQSPAPRASQGTTPGSLGGPRAKSAASSKESSKERSSENVLAAQASKDSVASKFGRGAKTVPAMSSSSKDRAARSSGSRSLSRENSSDRLAGGTANGLGRRNSSSDGANRNSNSLSKGSTTSAGAGARRSGLGAGKSPQAAQGKRAAKTMAGAVDTTLVRPEDDGFRTPEVNTDSEEMTESDVRVSEKNVLYNDGHVEPVEQFQGQGFVLTLSPNSLIHDMSQERHVSCLEDDSDSVEENASPTVRKLTQRVNNTITEQTAVNKYAQHSKSVPPAITFSKGDAIFQQNPQRGYHSAGGGPTSSLTKLDLNLAVAQHNIDEHIDDATAALEHGSLHTVGLQNTTHGMSTAFLNVLTPKASLHKFDKGMDHDFRHADSVKYNGELHHSGIEVSPSYHHETEDPLGHKTKHNFLILDNKLQNLRESIAELVHKDGHLGAAASTGVIHGVSEGIREAIHSQIAKISQTGLAKPLHTTEEIVQIQSQNQDNIVSMGLGFQDSVRQSKMIIDSVLNIGGGVNNTTKNIGLAPHEMESSAHDSDSASALQVQPGGAPASSIPGVSSAQDSRHYASVMHIGGSHMTSATMELPRISSKFHKDHDVYIMDKSQQGAQQQQQVQQDPGRVTTAQNIPVGKYDSTISSIPLSERRMVMDHDDNFGSDDGLDDDFKDSSAVPNARAFASASSAMNDDDDDRVSDLLTNTTQRMVEKVESLTNSEKAVATSDLRFLANELEDMRKSSQKGPESHEQQKVELISKIEKRPSLTRRPSFQDPNSVVNQTIRAAAENLGSFRDISYKELAGQIMDIAREEDKLMQQVKISQLSQADGPNAGTSNQHHAPTAVRVTLGAIALQQDDSSNRDSKKRLRTLVRMSSSSGGLADMTNAADVSDTFDDRKARKTTMHAKPASTTQGDDDSDISDLDSPTSLQQPGKATHAALIKQRSSSFDKGRATGLKQTFNWYGPSQLGATSYSAIDTDRQTSTGVTLRGLPITTDQLTTLENSIAARYGGGGDTRLTAMQQTVQVPEATTSGINTFTGYFNTGYTGAAEKTSASSRGSKSLSPVVYINPNELQTRSFVSLLERSSRHMPPEGWSSGNHGQNYGSVSAADGVQLALERYSTRKAGGFVDRGNFKQEHEYRTNILRIQNHHVVRTDMFDRAREREEFATSHLRAKSHDTAGGTHQMIGSARSGSGASSIGGASTKSAHSLFHHRAALDKMGRSWVSAPPAQKFMHPEQYVLEEQKTPRVVTHPEPFVARHADVIGHHYQAHVQTSHHHTAHVHKHYHNMTSGHHDQNAHGSGHDTTTTSQLMQRLQKLTEEVHAQYHDRNFKVEHGHFSSSSSAAYSKPQHIVGQRSAHDDLPVNMQNMQHHDTVTQTRQSDMRLSQPRSKSRSSSKSPEVIEKVDNALSRFTTRKQRFEIGSKIVHGGIALNTRTGSISSPFSQHDLTTLHGLQSVSAITAAGAISHQHHIHKEKFQAHKKDPEHDPLGYRVLKPYAELIDQARSQSRSPHDKASRKKSPLGYVIRDPNQDETTSPKQSPERTPRKINYHRDKTPQQKPAAVPKVGLQQQNLLGAVKLKSPRPISSPRGMTSAASKSPRDPAIPFPFDLQQQISNSKRAASKEMEEQIAPKAAEFQKDQGSPADTRHNEFNKELEDFVTFSDAAQALERNFSSLEKLVGAAGADSSYHQSEKTKVLKQVDDIMAAAKDEARGLLKRRESIDAALSFLRNTNNADSADSVAPEKFPDHLRWKQKTLEKIGLHLNEVGKLAKAVRGVVEGGGSSGSSGSSAVSQLSPLSLPKTNQDLFEKLGENKILIKSPRPPSDKSKSKESSRLSGNTSSDDALSTPRAERVVGGRSLYQQKSQGQAAVTKFHTDRVVDDSPRSMRGPTSPRLSMVDRQLSMSGTSIGSVGSPTGQLPVFRSSTQLREQFRTANRPGPGPLDRKKSSTFGSLINTLLGGTEVQESLSRAVIKPGEKAPGGPGSPRTSQMQMTKSKTSIGLGSLEEINEDGSRVRLEWSPRGLQQRKTTFAAPDSKEGSRAGSLRGINLIGSLVGGDSKKDAAANNANNNNDDFIDSKTALATGGSGGSPGAASTTSAKSSIMPLSPRENQDGFAALADEMSKKSRNSIVDGFIDRLSQPGGTPAAGLESGGLKDNLAVRQMRSVPAKLSRGASGSPGSTQVPVGKRVSVVDDFLAKINRELKDDNDDADDDAKSAEELLSSPASSLPKGRSVSDFIADLEKDVDDEEKKSAETQEALKGEISSRLASLTSLNSFKK